MSSPTAPLNLRPLVAALFVHKWTALTLFITSTLAILLAVMLWPYSYEARATLLIKLGRENVSVPGIAQSSSQVLNTGLRREDINTEIEMLQSRSLAKRVVQDLGHDSLDPPGKAQPGWMGAIKGHLIQGVRALAQGVKNVAVRLGFDRHYSREEQLVQSIMKQLTAEQVQQSHIIEARLRWSDPEAAAAILSALVDSYLQLHLQAFSQPGQQNFFKAQTELLAERIARQEQELEALQSRHQVYAGGSQERVLQERLSQAKAGQQATRAELSEVESQIKDLRQRLASGGETVQQATPDAVIGEQRRRLHELEIERTKMLSRYLATAEVVRNLDAEISAQRQRIRQQETDFLERQIRALDARAAALRAKERAQRAQIESDQGELETVTRYSVDIRRLQRQIKLDEDSYATYRGKLEEARITDVLDRERIVNVAVVQPVSVPERPVAPRKALVAAIGVLFSLLLAIVITLLLEYFDSSIRSIEDIERVLGLPYLGSVREC